MMMLSDLKKEGVLRNKDSADKRRITFSLSTMRDLGLIAVDHMYEASTR